MIYNIDDKVRYLSIDELGSEYIFTKNEGNIIEIKNSITNDKIYEPLISLLGKETIITNKNEINNSYYTSILDNIETPEWLLTLNKKNDKNLNLKNLTKLNRTHYLKINITKNMSIRYHFTFLSKKELENKWILKFHNEAHYQEIDDRLAGLMIKEHNIKEYQEIIGIQKNNEFNKIIINNGNINDLNIIKE